MAFPIREPRSDGHRPLADFVTGDGPFVTAYLDVSSGHRRDTAPGRLESMLERLATRSERSHTEAQATVVRQSIDLIEPEDGMLTILADRDGNSLITGFPSTPPDDLVVVADLLVLAPLLVAEQARIHHVVAVVSSVGLTVVVVPRHGQPTHRTVAIADDAEAVAVIGRLAIETDTSLVIVAGPEDRRARIESDLRGALPPQIGLAPVAAVPDDVDGLAAAVKGCLGHRASAKEQDIVRFWTFHRQRDQAVDGLVDTHRLLSSGEASLAVVVEDTFGPDGPRPSADVDSVIARALQASVPIGVLRPGMLTLRSGIGAVSADRIDPAQVGAWLER